MGIGISELLLILVIVVVIFGTKRLKNVGADLGEAIKGFRNAVKDGEKPDIGAEKDNPILEGEVSHKEKDKV
ncbi:MAG: twin-arginine translocase TatA/TatE family subunit [Methylomonas sp.]|jgi:sec-independent protein translocase protein TatA